MKYSIELVVLGLLSATNYCFSQKRVKDEKLKVSDYKVSELLSQKDFVNIWYFEDEDDWEKVTIKDYFFQSIKLHRFEIDSTVYIFLERNYKSNHIGEKSYKYQKGISGYKTVYYYFSEIKQKGNITSISLTECQWINLESIKNHIESLTIKELRKELSLHSAFKRTIKYVAGNIYKFILEVKPAKNLYKFDFNTNYIEITKTKISSVMDLLEK